MKALYTEKSASILNKLKDTRSFKLLRYFTFISLSSIIITSLLLGIWVRQIAIDNLTLSEERNSIALTQVLSNFVWPQYNDFIKSAGKLSADEIRKHPKTRLLDTFITEQVKDLDVIKIKIYDLNGLTVFSSDFKQIGLSKKSHSAFQYAIKGQTISSLSFRDTIYEHKELISNRHIIATYVPVRPNDKNLIEGVFEVYKDVTPIIKEINTIQTQVISGIVGILALLFIVLYLVVRRADRIINEQKEKQQQTTEELRNFAIYDTLTGLPNRILFLDKLNHALQFALRKEKLVILMYIDLDRFKQVNDNLGHDAGDQLLRKAAKRFTKCIRASDTVARMSGDEFTIILEDISNIETATLTAQRIINEMMKPFSIDKHEVYITSSIGLSVYPFENDDALSLAKKADAAMYYSKTTGRNTFHYYFPDMIKQRSKRYDIQNDLSAAITDSQFEIFFQPKVSLADWTMQGMEALIRWQHPQHGDVPVSELISILEDTGKICQVGEWVLRESCRLTKKWQDDNLAPLRIAVNISAIQLKQPDFYDMLISVLDDTGLDASFLELEITESCLMEDIDKNIDILKRLKSKGITLTIDDFGTGYSSLSYLSQLPIDTLKIDKSFVIDMIENKQQRSITMAIISFAHELDLNVVAEGIENIEQLSFINNLQCTTAQGYLLSLPLSEHEFYTLHKSGVNFKEIANNPTLN